MASTKSCVMPDLVDAIHEKWKLDEVVKLKFEWPLSCNMKRTHEILEVSFCMKFGILRFLHLLRYETILIIS
jgi:hypothetical protein